MRAPAPKGLFYAAPGSRRTSAAVQARPHARLATGFCSDEYRSRHTINSSNVRFLFRRWVSLACMATGVSGVLFGTIDYFYSTGKRVYNPPKWG
jgi:hypothetical protein